MGVNENKEWNLGHASGSQSFLIHRLGMGMSEGNDWKQGRIPFSCTRTA